MGQVHIRTSVATAADLIVVVFFPNHVEIGFQSKQRQLITSVLNRVNACLTSTNQLLLVIRQLSLKVNAQAMPADM